MEDHKDKGFIVVGCHSQAGTKEEVTAVCKERGITYPIFASGKVAGSDFSGLPYCYVFDDKGEMVFEGRHTGRDKAIEAALAKADDWILGPNDYKKLSKEAASILARKNLGKTMATLRTLKDGEGEESAEASRMFERLDGYGTREWTRVDGLVSERPSQAMEAMSAFAKLWKGDELGTRAEERLAELKKDDAFKAAIAADALLIEIETELEGGKPCKYGQPLDLGGCSECQEKNGKLIQSLAGKGNLLLKKYGTTPAAERIKTLFKANGIPMAE